MKNLIVFAVFASVSCLAYQCYSWEGFAPANSAMNIRRHHRPASNVVVSRNDSANPYYRANPYYKPDPVSSGPKMIRNPFFYGEKASHPKPLSTIVIHDDGDLGDWK